MIYNRSKLQLLKVIPVISPTVDNSMNPKLKYNRKFKELTKQLISAVAHEKIFTPVRIAITIAVLINQSLILTPN